jgi:hypothetical protein
MSKDSFEGQAEKKKEYLKKKIEEEDHDNREDLGKRISMIDELVRADLEANKLSNPKIFVSFAGEYGAELASGLVIPALRRLKIPDTGRGFETRNGMMSHGDPEVIRHISGMIDQCCIFFGILTKEFKIEASGPIRWAPGGWVLLEAGMALSKGLRIVLFVEQEVHKNFWFNMLGSVRHAAFDRNKPTPGINLAKVLVLENYQSLRHPPHRH